MHTKGGYMVKTGKANLNKLNDTFSFQDFINRTALYFMILDNDKIQVSFYGYPGNNSIDIELKAEDEDLLNFMKQFNNLFPKDSDLFSISHESGKIKISSFKDKEEEVTHSFLQRGDPEFSFFRQVILGLSKENVEKLEYVDNEFNMFKENPEQYIEYKKASFLELTSSIYDFIFNDLNDLNRYTQGSIRETNLKSGIIYAKQDLRNLNKILNSLLDLFDLKSEKISDEEIEKSRKVLLERGRMYYYHLLTEISDLKTHSIGAPKEISLLNGLEFIKKTTIDLGKLLSEINALLVLSTSVSKEKATVFTMVPNTTDK